MFPAFTCTGSSKFKLFIHLAQVVTSRSAIGSWDWWLLSRRLCTYACLLIAPGNPKIRGKRSYLGTLQTWVPLITWGTLVPRNPSYMVTPHCIAESGPLIPGDTYKINFWAEMYNKGLLISRYAWDCSIFLHVLQFWILAQDFKLGVHARFRK